MHVIPNRVYVYGNQTETLSMSIFQAGYNEVSQEPLGATEETPQTLPHLSDSQVTHHLSCVPGTLGSEGPRRRARQCQPQGGPRPAPTF